MVILYPMIETNTYDKISLLRLAFKGLEDKELQEMADLTKLCVYPPEQVLCHEGAYEDTFYIIAEGSVVISKKNAGRGRRAGPARGGAGAPGR